MVREIMIGGDIGGGGGYLLRSLVCFINEFGFCSRFLVVSNRNRFLVNFIRKRIYLENIR